MSPRWDAPAPEAGPASRPNAAGLTRAALGDLLVSLGEPAWRGKQLFTGLLRQRWTRWEAFSNLSKPLRARLEAEVDLHWPAIVQSQASADGSTKHLFELGDSRQVEGVHMPYEDRVTLCLSSQVGCAMGCTFCATGQMGILRNLSAAEIVGQVVAMLNHHGHPAERPVNLVFMGMGEPLHNLDHLHRAIRLLCHPAGLGLGKGRITVSTSGLVSGIEKLATLEPRPLLALSLNATTDEARSRTMPVNRVWNLARLRQALDAWGPRRGEKFTFEYVLIAGENDTEGDAARLADWLGDLRSAHNLNLIPLNEHDASALRAPDEARVQQFAGWLKGRGCFVTVRRSRGRDIQGACGQLVKPPVRG